MPVTDAVSIKAKAVKTTMDASLANDLSDITSASRLELLLIGWRKGQALFTNVDFGYGTVVEDSGNAQHITNGNSVAFSSGVDSVFENNLILLDHF